ncbi:MAG: hypothetical protein KF912_00520 [Phycisphaeraceae bacterium]|nr:hypothetical protein [Phycisphaeraceae bacterium]MBX3365782.1 hypothetical protein [Phycisphaeraceae bacterium]
MSRQSEVRRHVFQDLNQYGPKSLEGRQIATICSLASTFLSVSTGWKSGTVKDTAAYRKSNLLAAEAVVKAIDVLCRTGRFPQEPVIDKWVKRLFAFLFHADHGSPKGPDLSHVIESQLFHKLKQIENEHSVDDVPTLRYMLASALYDLSLTPERPRAAGSQVHRTRRARNERKRSPAKSHSIVYPTFWQPRPGDGSETLLSDTDRFAARIVSDPDADGVHLLTGARGSGKTTVLNSIEWFARNPIKRCGRPLFLRIDVGSDFHPTRFTLGLVKEIGRATQQRFADENRLNRLLWGMKHLFGTLGDWCRANVMFLLFAMPLIIVLVGVGVLHQKNIGKYAEHMVSLIVAILIIAGAYWLGVKWRDRCRRSLGRDVARRRVRGRGLIIPVLFTMILMCLAVSTRQDPSQQGKTSNATSKNGTPSGDASADKGSDTTGKKADGVDNKRVAWVALIGTRLTKHPEGADPDAAKQNNAGSNTPTQTSPSSRNSENLHYVISFLSEWADVVVLSLALLCAIAPPVWWNDYLKLLALKRHSVDHYTAFSKSVLSSFGGAGAAVGDAITSLLPNADDPRRAEEADLSFLSDFMKETLIRAVNVFGSVVIVLDDTDIAPIPGRRNGARPTDPPSGDMLKELLQVIRPMSKVKGVRCVVVALDHRYPGLVEDKSMADFHSTCREMYLLGVSDDLNDKEQIVKLIGLTLDLRSRGRKPKHESHARKMLLAPWEQWMRNSNQVAEFGKFNKDSSGSRRELLREILRVAYANRFDPMWEKTRPADCDSLEDDRIPLRHYLRSTLQDKPKGRLAPCITAAQVSPTRPRPRGVGR